MNRNFSYQRQVVDAPSHLSPGNFPSLSFEQQQVWLLTQLIPDLPVAHVCVTVHLPAPLEVAALEWSVNQIVQRHDVWRTTFPMINGQPVPLIQPALALSLPLVDFRTLPEAEREAEALRLATREAQHLFDVAHGPLLRVLLIQWDELEYRLFLTLHRLIADEVSLSHLLLPELHLLYESRIAGQPLPLPLLSLHYTDYVCWQRQWLSQASFDEHVTYWKRQLRGASTRLALPTDRPCGVMPTAHGSMVRFALSSILTDSLSRTSYQEKVSMKTLLLAAFQTLLFRYSGQEDLLLGTVTERRTHPALQHLMGPCCQVLALRTNLSGNPTFCELLRRVHEVMTSALAHGNVPFGEVFKALHRERDGEEFKQPQVFFSFVPVLPDLPCNWSLSWMDIHTGATPFDLALELSAQPDGLVGRFVYNSGLFDESTISRMVEHWQVVLESIIAHPKAHIGTLPLLPETERHQLLAGWNATQAAYPGEKCVHQLFEEQVESTPEALAVICERERLTYRELNQRANRLAHLLQQRGVGPDVLVGICVDRSIEMVVGLLGILKAGGAYVPLDPTYPAERLAFMLENSQASVVVTQHHLIGHLPLCGVTEVYLDTDRAMLAQQREMNLTPTNTPDDLAYVIYTSGSTGRPKGVQISHRAVVNFLTSMREQPGLAAQDRLLAVTTLSFDIAVLELFLPLVVGACVMIASHSVAMNGERLAEALERSRATVMQATPITWRLLLDTGWQGNPRLKILCGGEALPLSLARELLPKGASLWNLYGPTETTIWSSVCQIKPEDEVISIGRPIANTQMYVLDSRLQVVPIGVPGELYIGGIALSRGYLNLQELTAERFLSHPFCDEPGARVYQTGDLARCRPDGTIQLLGRSDHQVKIRGYRIELGEIEAVLGQHPAVRHGVVVVREETPGSPRLVAYLVLHHDQSATEADLKEHVTKLLPSYMVPSAFVILDAFPLTPNGKVDRRALPVPDSLRHTGEEIMVAPRSLVQYQLVHLWEERLGVQPIGITDNFFTLGGHSLLAAQLVAGIEQTFGKKLPLSTLFAGPTIEQLARVLEQQEQTSPHTPVIAVQRGTWRRPFFFLHGDWTGGAFYCFTLARALGEDQPFYAVEPYKVDEHHAPPSLETMAAAHLASVRAVQPVGPYLLGGFCNGGLVSYEMARQLRAEGEQVDLLLVAPDLPAHFKWVRDAIRHLGNWLAVPEVKQMQWFLWLRHLQRHVYRHLWPTSDKVQGFEKVLAVDDRLDALFPADEALRKDYEGVLAWLNAGYQPAPYPDAITVFWTQEEPRTRAVWRKVARIKEGNVQVMPGKHMDCVTKHIHLLAERLGTHLRLMQTAEDNPTP